MFINQQIITIFFKLVNFGIIIGLGVYVFKKHALPSIYSLMAQQDADKKYLSDQQLFLEAQQLQLDALMQQDIVKSDFIKTKVEAWRALVEKEQDCQKKLYLDRVIELNEKNSKKRELIKHALMKNLVAQRVIKDLGVSLTHHFEDNEAGTMYLDSIIFGVNERKP